LDLYSVFLVSKIAFTFSLCRYTMAAAHGLQHAPPSKEPDATAAGSRTTDLPAAAAVVPAVDWQRCVVLALVHDVAETVVGDITPLDGISHEVKEEREGEAMERIRAILSPWWGCTR
jgi:hypothetical protein